MILVKVSARDEHRTTKVASGIVILVLRTWNMQDAARPVVRVESIISEVIVHLTVKILAAALRNRSDLNAARSKFCRIVAGLNGNFLHHIRI